jgi:hypothetical protein
MYQYSLTCTLNINPAHFECVADELEVSLPCINCERDHRTIIFKGIETQGICTPRNKCTGFLGQLTSREVSKNTNEVLIKYIVEFDFKPFYDKKHNIKANLPEFGWGRVHFTLKCDKCGSQNELSTQDNLGRPWQQKCACGNIVYQEKEQPFMYKIEEMIPLSIFTN